MARNQFPQSQDSHDQVSYEIGLKIRDLEESHKLMKERVLLIGQNLIDFQEKAKSEITSIKKDIYEVMTATGRKIKVTKDHSLFALGKDNSLEEIKPTELKENKSFIAVPRRLPIEGKEVREINLMDYLEVFKEDFLEGSPIGKIFENRESDFRDRRYCVRIFSI